MKIDRKHIVGIDSFLEMLGRLSTEEIRRIKENLKRYQSGTIFIDCCDVELNSREEQEDE